MHCVKKLSESLYWVGGSDRRLALFENVFPIPRGVSYNAYLMLDEKTVLMDTVDRSVGDVFEENVEHVLAGRPLDYVVVNHMEPDHCATLAELLRRHPETVVVGNAKTFQMIGQFFPGLDLTDRSVTVAEGDTLSTGAHTLHFVMMPMVHWPEAMAAFDSTDGVLFSADAFGAFGALSGHLFADEVNFEKDWLDDTRRYYANIVGKYGQQVQTVLKKAAGLDIRMICPLHGLLWRGESMSRILDLYEKWSTFTPEGPAVLIAYASVYGHTENAANILACRLADAGVKDIAVYDVSAAHPSYLVSEAFRCSHLVFPSTTYNGGIFCNMETLLLDLKAHGLRDRTVALVQNGSWGPVAAKQMGDILGAMKDIRLLEGTVTLRSTLKPGQEEELNALVQAIVEDMKARFPQG